MARTKNVARKDINVPRSGVALKTTGKTNGRFRVRKVPFDPRKRYWQFVWSSEKRPDCLGGSYLFDPASEPDQGRRDAMLQAFRDHFVENVFLDIGDSTPLNVPPKFLSGDWCLQPTPEELAEQDEAVNIIRTIVVCDWRH